MDVELIYPSLEREYPRHYDMLSSSLAKLAEDSSVSVNNILSEFIKARKFVIGQMLATALINGSSEAEELLDKYNSLSSVEDVAVDDTPVYVGLSVDSLGAIVDKDKLITVLPEDLNRRLGGGLLRGHHMLVYARPETGKSLVVLNMCRGFLSQELTVLYIGNEDPQGAIRSRMISCLLDKPRSEIIEMRKQDVDELAKEEGADKFIFSHLSPGTFTQIRGLCNQYQPDVLIVDQIRNIHSGTDGLVQGQERAGMEMRNIASKYDLLAISVAQAGESASNSLVLTLSDVDSSKTGLPASTDVMVGIGVNDDYSNRGKRMMSLPKNKPGADHSYFSIDVNEATSRVS